MSTIRVTEQLYEGKHIDYPIGCACPWSGVACTCDKFPWLEGALLPKVCSDLIRDKMQAMEPFRKLTKKG